MEDFTLFVSSRGILKSCVIHAEIPRSSDQNYRLEIQDSKNLDRPTTVYLSTDSIIQNIDTLLKSELKYIILITGDSDASLSDELIEQSAPKCLLASERLIAWYAQNLACSHPKLFHLPIGMDYHTINERTTYWSLRTRSPLAQEFELIQTLKDSPSLSERYFQAYCNWHFQLERGDRQECLAKLDKKLCYFEPTRLPRLSSWQRQSQFMFTVSPFGAGLDCHRTWETLVLGGIPIVRKSSIVKLFQKLPVLVVDDWSDVNSNLLSSFASDALSRRFDFTSLFLKNWKREIKGLKQLNRMKEMTIKEFKELIAGRTC